MQHAWQVQYTVCGHTSYFIEARQWVLTFDILGLSGHSKVMQCCCMKGSARALQRSISDFVVLIAAIVCLFPSVHTAPERLWDTISRSKPDQKAVTHP